jgi:Protein of unknown function (DUF3352)
MRTPLTTLAGLAAALALVAGGCGGQSNTSASGGSDSAGAAIAPAGAPLYAMIDTDLSSDQWKQVDALFDKFPGKQKLLTRLRTSFENDAKVSWQNDVKPALGDELDIAVLDFKSAQVVGFTQPGDEAKFDALVKKANAQETDRSNKLVVDDYKGWKIFSNKQATLDAFKQRADAGAIGDAATYKDATGSLSGDSLASIYVNGTKATAALQQALPAASSATTSNGKLVWAVANLVAENDGARLEAKFKAQDLKAQLKPYKSALVDEVPAGALLFASFNLESFGGRSNLRQQLEQGLGSAGAVAGVKQLLPIVEQLGGLFGHENALYVRPGALIPEVTLITRPDSPAQGTAVVDRLVSQLAALAGSPLVPKPVTIGSTHAKVVDLGQVAIYYGAQGSDFIVTNQQQAFEDLKATGGKLSGDATFKEAKQASGLPDETNGFVYVNLKDSIPAIEGLARLGGTSIPPDVDQNLRPLRTLVLWADASGNTGGVTAFLELK